MMDRNRRREMELDFRVLADGPQQIIMVVRQMVLLIMIKDGG